MGRRKGGGGPGEGKEAEKGAEAHRGPGGTEGKRPSFTGVGGSAVGGRSKRRRNWSAADAA